MGLHAAANFLKTKGLAVPIVKRGEPFRKPVHAL
jgi:hypothetical protein